VLTSGTSSTSIPLTSASVTTTTRQCHFITIIMQSICSNTISASVVSNATAQSFKVYFAFALKILARFGWLCWQNVKHLMLFIILSCLVFTPSLGKRIRRMMCIWIITTWPILFIPSRSQWNIGNRPLVSIQLLLCWHLQMYLTPALHISWSLLPFSPFPCFHYLFFMPKSWRQKLTFHFFAILWLYWKYPQI